MNITITPADKVFSHYIRLRDQHCVRCFSAVRTNVKGLPVSHTASHFHSRGKQGTRFDPMNVDTLCFPCHNLWGGDQRSIYKTFKLDQLGEREFDLMTLRANSYHKKDYAMALIESKALLGTIYAGR